MQASSQDNTNKEIEKDYLQYIWKYFELHAIQRITLFRYYIIFFSLYGYAIAHFSIKHTHTNQESKEAVLFIVIFSVIFFLITCMFMFLDHRNKVLIHHAEDAFKKYEEVFKEIDSKYKIFQLEEKNRQCMRHTQCFYVIFLIGLLLSVVFFLHALNIQF